MSGWVGELLFGLACWFGLLLLVVWALSRFPPGE